MLSEVRERVEELGARAGLRAPAPALAGAVIVLVLAVVGWGLLRAAPSTPAVEAEPRPAPQARKAPAAEATAAGQLVVHVVGEVRRPGVYHLPKGARAEDAVTAAGGPLGSADLGGLNLARIVADGEQLVVPAQGEHTTAASPPSRGGTKAAAGGKVDINHASAEELDALPGVGPSTAAKIVQEREANGPYKSVEDLARVPGIGPKKLDALKDLVTAG
jgi:competence protein ComEA